MTLLQKNIRSRIAVYFTLLTSVILVSLSIAVYYFSARYSHAEFYRRMAYRADITAQLYIDKGYSQAELFEAVHRQNQDMLIEEHEQIIHLDDFKSSARSGNWPENFVEALLESGRSSYRDGDRFFYGALYRSDPHNFVVVVNALDFYGEAKLRRLAWILSLSTIIALGITFFVSRLLAKRSLLPLVAVIRDFKEFENAPWQQRLNIEGKPEEVAELAQAFNRLQDRIAAIIQTQHNFISNASHELKTPLTSIVGESEVVLQKERTAEQYRASLERINSEADRLQTLTLRLLRLAQTGFSNEPPKFEEIDLIDLLVKLQVEYHQTRSDCVALELPETGDQYCVEGHPGLLKIALANLIENALKFSDGEVEIRLSNSEAEVFIEVIDSGRGIPPEAIPHLYEPFYRARNARSVPGFGIGLPLTQNILRIHSAQLHFISNVGEGTTARIIMNRLL